MTDAFEQFNAPINAEEEYVLKLHASGKSPGPDGLTLLYHQIFREQLLPHLTSLYNTFLDGSPIPSTMLHSYISLVPKPNKDHLDCSNYRPIALLNSDLKIFTTILANHLSFWLPHLVHKDQVGFVSCRQ